MQIKGAIRNNFEKQYKEAQELYEDGQYLEASRKYEKCANLLEKLADNSERGEKEDYLIRAEKFRDVSEGIKKGRYEFHPDGVKPSSKEARDKGSAKKKEVEEKDFEDLVMEEDPSVSFEDVAGMSKVKQEIEEAIIYPFEKPELYDHFDVAPGGGILLYGPPGCGKTMVAAATASESGASFINVNISDIKDKYVGESEKNIQRVFDLAKEQERAILFFDEIDALGAERSSTNKSHESSLVNEFLHQMDGVSEKGQGIDFLVLGATNRPWEVDLALRRSKRFTESILVPHPDREARIEILQKNLEERPLDDDVDLDKLADMTGGFSGAEVVDICDRAARIPLRESLDGEKRDKINFNDFKDTIQEKNSILKSWYKRSLREIGESEEIEMFEELIQEGNDFLEREEHGN